MICCQLYTGIRSFRTFCSQVFSLPGAKVPCRIQKFQASKVSWNPREHPGMYVLMKLLLPKNESSLDFEFWRTKVPGNFHCLSLRAQCHHAQCLSCYRLSLNAFCLENSHKYLCKLSAKSLPKIIFRGLQFAASIMSLAAVNWALLVSERRANFDKWWNPVYYEMRSSVLVKINFLLVIID